LIEIGDLTQAWAKLIAALRACPRILGYDWAREIVRWLTFMRARAAESPVTATRSLCAQIEAAAANRSIKEQLWARKTTAMVWVKMAILLAFSPPVSDRVDQLCVRLYRSVKRLTMKKQR
jgi:hypothetical protein